MKTFTSFLKKVLALLIFAIAIAPAAIAQWSAPINLSPNAHTAWLNESMGSCIGVSGDTIHVVWNDKINAKKSIVYYTRSLDSGLTWSVPVALTDTISNPNSWNPAIAVNGRNVHVVWRQFQRPGHCASMYMHSIDGGNTWNNYMLLDSTSDWPAIAVSGKNVYIVNDWYINATNSVIYFLGSSDNGLTWSPRKQITFGVLRNEDEAISAQGAHLHVSWNGNKTNKFKIYYKTSADSGLTWGPDIGIDSAYDYNTMVYANGANVDIVGSGAPAGNHYQILLSQSADTGVTWGAMQNVSNDTAHPHYYPDMVRDGSDIHIVCNSTIGGKYFHSANGGLTWDPPFVYATGNTFVAYTGCALHIIYVNGGKIYYIRKAKGNGGPSCPVALATDQVIAKNNLLTVYPNPAKNSITLQSSTELNEIKIYTLLGEVIYAEKASGLQKQIDISNFSAGVYFLQANNTFIKIVKE